jgi:hypothetical protein
MLRTEGKVKVAVRKIDFHRRADLSEFHENVRTMTELNHPNLLKVFGTCEVDGRHCLVTAYMKNGSLGRYLRRVKIDASTQFARQVFYIFIFFFFEGRNWVTPFILPVIGLKGSRASPSYLKCIANRAQIIMYISIKS